MRRAVTATALAIAAAALAPAAAQASFSVTADAATKNESEATAAFTVSRTGGEAVVDTSTISISATGGAGPPSVTSMSFAPNDTADRHFTVPIDDGVDQATDPHAVTVTIAVTSSSPVAEGLGTASATTNVTDNDTTVDVASANVGEGGTAAITLTPRAQVDHEMTVTYSTADGTATSGADYTPVSGTVTLPAHSIAAQTISIPTTQDALDEDDETLSVSLSSAGGSISTTSASVTILDDDPPPLVAAVGGRVAEGSAGIHAISVFVGLSAPSAKTVTVSYASRDGTATAPTDYGGVSGRLTFAPGETGKNVTILVNGDKTPEPDEAFVLELSAPENATLAGGQQAATIVLADDDGYQALPGAGTTTPGTTAKGDTSDPDLRLGRLVQRGSRLALPVSCPRTETSCSGAVTLFTVASRKHPERRLARVRFTLKGGAKRTLTLKVARKKLSAKRTKVRAYAVTEDAAGNVGTSAVSATLRR